MIGVVLWSDPADRKAVFWCEDQGDLAYYEDMSQEQDGFGFFDAGDMVQFEIKMERKLRRAQHPTLIQEHACSGLPESLRSTAPRKSVDTGTRKSAKIIAFGKRDKDAAAPLSALKA
ncbi:MAG: hypothetical protein WA790_13025 [Sulfitobacter sp.]